MKETRDKMLRGIVNEEAEEEEEQDLEIINESEI